MNTNATLSHLILTAVACLPGGRQVSSDYPVREDTEPGRKR